MLRERVHALAVAEEGRPGPEYVPDVSIHLRGLLDKDAEFHRRAAATHRQLGDHWKLAKNLAHLAVELPEEDEARRCAHEASEILAEFDDPKSIALRASLPG